MSRRIRGAGTVCHRKDGRWEAKAYLPASNGTVRRLCLYGKTAKEASDKLTMQLAKCNQGIPIPDRAWTVGDYLDYYLHDVAPVKLRPKTLELYESVVRVHLKPLVGSYSLTRLSVTALQKLLNDKLAGGTSLRTVRLIRTVLSAALTRAMREELLARNVARLVELKPHRAKQFALWTVEETTRFLHTAVSDPLYAAFLLLIVYGMRRGEVLGLRWQDVDWQQNKLRVRQQLQQIHSELSIGPVKTNAGERDLPLLQQTREALSRHQAAAAAIEILPTGEASAVQSTGNDVLVFLSEAHTPIWPRNFVRRFHQLCEKAGLRYTRLHDLRHMAITMLKDLRIPDRDIQLIAGHAHISTTQQIYQHGNTAIQKEGLDGVSRVLLGSGNQNEALGRQVWASNPNFVAQVTSFVSGGTSGARTHDTLLKSLTKLSGVHTLTPAIEQLRSQMNVYALGAIGVSLGVKNNQHDQPNAVLWQWISLRDALVPQPRRFIDRLISTSTTHH